jgi:large subunit ribosomal protein L25
MASVNLSAAPRAESGKGVARKLRAEGQVPAILYGFGTDPRSVSLDAVALRKALSTPAGSRVVLQLKVEGGEKPFAVLIKELQRHPLTRNITHVDLMSIDLDQPVDVNVPILAIGTPVGVRSEGGTLEWQRRELQLRVLPTKIPENIEIDVSEMHLNDALHIGDISIEGAEMLEEEKLTICSVKTTRMSVPTPEEEAEGEGEEGEEGEGEAAAEGAEGESGDEGGSEGGDSES